MTKMACVRRALTVSRCFLVIALLLLVVTSASGQTTSATDGTTPQGLAPGSPAGSYALSGFDSINPYNGNLNFHLPLLQISGRGDAQMTMMLALNTKRWRVKHTSRVIGGEPVESFAPEQNWWTPADSGYGPGLLYGRQTGAGNWSCFSYPKLYTHTLTRLTFITPDGTEYELRDQATGGQPIAVTSCTSNGASRGTDFVSADGSAVTFVSDSSIFDSNVPQGLSLLNPAPSGFLIMRNGLRYRIDAGLVTWIRDRNGNKLSFGYDGNGRVISITDSLNRVVTIAYQSDEGPTYGICDKITFNGFNGAPRIIRIARYGLLENSFRPNAGYSKQKLSALFPELNGSQQTDYNPNVVSAVYLPDGRSYRFYYNPYGEFERVSLPTGGAIEYRMSSGSGVYPTDPDAGDYQIYRRVTERQVYPNGANLEGKTVYTASSSLPGDAHPWSTTVTIDQVNPSGTVLARSEHHFNGSGFASLFNTVGYYLYPAWDEGKEWRTFGFDSTGATALRRVTNTFQQRASVSWWSAYASQNNLDAAFEPALDTRLTEAVRKLLDVTPNLVSDQKYYYDQYNNQTAVEEFDYGSSSPPAYPTRRTETDYVATGESNGIDYTATNVHSRSLPKERRVYSVNPTSGAWTQAASTHFYYDESSLTPRIGIVGWEAPATAAHGNLTSITKWLDTGGSITTSQQYDIAGHVVQTTDALGNTSLIEFASSSNTFAFATTMRTAVPDPAGSRGSNARLVTQYDYDLSSGLLKSITDPNNQITTASYNDGLDRLTAVVSPTGGGQVSYFYGDTVGNLFVRTLRAQDASTTLESYQYFDGLGRSIRTSQSEASGSIFADKQYDALGRVLQVSNPYRIGDTLRWTVTQYDGLGRIMTVTQPGGAQVGSAYSGNSVTVTDPAGKARTSVSDALGRVTSVAEDPGSAPHLNYQTSYTYDVLNELRKVVQGSQIRTFGYDSLKRLIRVKNPEHDINTSLPAFTDPVTSNTQWSVAFTYDGNSNLATRTDPRNITCTYTYDAMNRVLTRGYANDTAQTPPVDYKYDGVGTTALNALGKLTAVNTSGSFVSSQTYDNFDAMGRVLHTTQTTEGNVYNMSYGYDLAGNLISETYPSGRVVSTAFDVAGRISDVSSGVVHYASSFSYAAHGGVTDVKLGNNLWEHTTFEPNRLQPTDIDLGTSQGASDKLKLNYDYGPLTSNNGNVMGQTITIPSGPTLTQSFTYDLLNRLKSAQESNGTSWKQTFLYDQFGNRTIDAVNTMPSGLVGPNPQISALSNRVTSTGYSYDFAGNLTADGSGHTYGYDAENMQVKYDNTVAQYSYDGTGRRVKCVTNNGALTTLFVYDAMGKLLAEYTNTNPTGGSTSYLTTDAVDSTRIVTGTDPVSAVKARHDYLPFGEEIALPLGGRTAAQGYVVDSVRQKFTGQLRDTETQLDYFGARYYSCATGRFTSADSVAGGALNPQSLNLYCYVLNNPLVYTDPTGHVLDYAKTKRDSDWENWEPSEETAGQQASQPPAQVQQGAQGALEVGKLGEVTVKAGELATKKPGFLSRIASPFKWIGRRFGAVIHIGIELAFPSDYGSHHGTVGGAAADLESIDPALQSRFAGSAIPDITSEELVLHRYYGDDNDLKGVWLTPSGWYTPSEAISYLALDQSWEHPNSARSIIDAIVPAGTVVYHGHVAPIPGKEDKYPGYGYQYYVPGAKENPNIKWVNPRRAGQP